MTEVRTYKNSGTKYTPVPLEKRKTKIRKPDHPDAVCHANTWYVPVEVLPLEARQKPETRPDDDTLLHRTSCRCRVCRRPQAAVLWATHRGRLARGKKPKKLR